jgi:XTP/dITP diphosphohydrolase
MKLYLASGNAHKAAELQGLATAGGLNVEIVSARAVGGMPEVVEDSGTFVGNARKKALALRAKLPADAWALADDSGLCVDALNGGPGVESAYFAGPQGDGAANLAKLVTVMREVPQGSRGAKFVCVLLLIGPGGEEKIFEGEPVEEELQPYVQPTLDWKREKGLTFTHREITLVNAGEGYAGRCDVIAQGKKGQLVILDYKTRKTKEGEKVATYDGQGMQLAAYAVAHWGEAMLEKVTAANVFISTTEPGRMEVCKHDDLVSEWHAFKAACLLWRKMKGFDPRRIEV